MSEYIDISLIKGEMGWGDDNSLSIDTRHYIEQKIHDKNAEDFPVAYKAREEKPISEFVSSKFRSYMDSKGYGKDSADMTLLDEFVFGNRFNWLPQIIGSCFPAGTLIRMADGSQKPIEQIHLFEQILTAEGNISYIAQIGGREVSEDIYEIQACGHIKIRMTAEHPVLTKRGYVKASELCLNDYIAIPKYAPKESNYLHTINHYTQTRQQCRYAEKSAVGAHRCFGEKFVRVYRNIPDLIPMTEDFGWVCGLYLAEGCSDRTKLRWSLHSKELKTHAKKLFNIFKEMFNIELSITSKGNRCKVTLHSTVWSKVFESLFGNGSSYKRLHGDIASGNEPFLKGLLSGWLDGDGHRKETTNKNSGFWDGVSISKSLSLDMFNIANALGMNPTIRQCDPKISHGIKNRHRRYDVIIRDGDKRLQTIIEEKTVWKRMRSIEKVPFTGKVYNFEVPGDNSYVADGVGVHNCVASNTFRPWVRRVIYEISLKGDPEEFLGKSEFGPQNISFYAPFSYGCGRRRGRMRGGDGSFCEVQYDSLIKDGVITCNNLKLLEILKRFKADGPRDFPEPQNASLYRRFGNWEFLDELLPTADFRLLESVKVNDIDTHIKLSRQYKPASVCSGIAIRKIGTHKDGFDIHAQNPRDSWAHNMSFCGHFESSDGKIFIRLSNESWGKNVIYNIPIEEISRWYSQRMVTVQAIGEIDLPDSIFAV